MTTRGSQQKNSSWQDRRYFPRWDGSTRAEYRLENGVGAKKGVTKDLSCAGMCLQVDEPPLFLKQKVLIILYLSSVDCVKLTGEIVWARMAGDSNEVGILFRDVSSKAADVILNHAFEVDRQKFVRHFFKGWQGPVP